jgi:2-phospho-L-lactate guanylyltransferase
VRIALIPIKELSQAKERLSPALDPDARRMLMIAMFRDVLAAALACDALDGVAVDSRDPEVQAIASAAGATCLVEAGDLNEALTAAAHTLRERGVERIVVLVGDLPLAKPEEIAQVLAADEDVVIVPSQDGGTNALSLAPEAIEFQFGLASAAHHAVAARDAGLSVLQLQLRGLGFDVDTPQALRLLLGIQHDEPGRVGAATLTALTKIARIVNIERA